MASEKSTQCDHGLYVIWLTVNRPITVTVGSLGKVNLNLGRYAYVGSAQRARTARINRHLKVDKRKHWHLDYIRPYTIIDEVSLHDGSKEDECTLVLELIRAIGAERAHPQFGSSDCRCGGHLLVVKRTSPPNQQRIT